MEDTKFIIEKIINSISKDDNVKIATTNKEIFDAELIDSDVKLKRYYHYIIVDKKQDIKPFFRALRNGGYIISLKKFDEEYLQDIGFSAISEFDNLQIIKKVHSWNDF
ncbi:hypothetical protein [Caminibacter mediatlanticus]|uniref:Uncharacterized protein n=1 Tax=Caminibacter mediatlanticus TB-2 TaxID=391592 RepID=A0AAI9AGI5_9BACT|nr:hypothetical protein [Caminibacter mediatlanticus]EDM23258.1 hypothetical protein CMTB2_06156 [Caminibacter mediatlanticus TB-2]